MKVVIMAICISLLVTFITYLLDLHYIKKIKIMHLHIGYLLGIINEETNVDMEKIMIDLKLIQKNHNKYRNM